MKKIAVLLAFTSLFIFGCNEVHVSYPLIVKGVVVNTNTTHKTKYRVELTSLHPDEETLWMYTDKSFCVGDTIK